MAKLEFVKKLDYAKGKDFIGGFNNPLIKNEIEHELEKENRRVGVRYRRGYGKGGHRF